MPTGSSVSITNLAAFRRDLKAAEDASPRELTKALKAAGAPILADVRGRVPHLTGTLAAGFKASARGSTGLIVNRVPYAAGSEFGRHGKWAGFERYGSAPGRFVGAALEAQGDEVARIIAAEMREIVEIHGWAR